MSNNTWSRLKLGAVTLALAFLTACSAGQKESAKPVGDNGVPADPGDQTEEVTKAEAHDLYESGLDGLGPPTVPIKKDKKNIEEIKTDEGPGLHAE